AAGPPTPPGQRTPASRRRGDTRLPDTARDRMTRRGQPEPPATCPRVGAAVSVGRFAAPIQDPDGQATRTGDPVTWSRRPAGVVAWAGALRPGAAGSVAWPRSAA